MRQPETVQLPNGELNPVVSVLQGVLHSLQPYDVPFLYIRDLQQDKRQTLESRQLHQTFGKGQLERVGPFCIYIFLIQVQFELEYDKPCIASEH